MAAQGTRRWSSGTWQDNRMTRYTGNHEKYIGVECPYPPCVDAPSQNCATSDSGVSRPANGDLALGTRLRKPARLELSDGMIDSPVA